MSTIPEIEYKSCFWIIEAVLKLSSCESNSFVASVLSTRCHTRSIWNRKLVNIQNIFTVSGCQVRRTIQKTVFETSKLKSCKENGHSLAKFRTKSKISKYLVLWTNSNYANSWKRLLREFIPRDSHEFSFAITRVFEALLHHAICLATLLRHKLQAKLQAVTCLAIIKSQT